MVELTETLFPWGVADMEIFQLLRESFHCLDKGERRDLIPIIFEIRAMTLGGYAINLDKCCICGRAYTGRGMAVFKRNKGGISCLGCEEVSALAPPMRPDTVKLMRIMGSKPLKALLEIKCVDEVLAEIKCVLKMHREYHLGRRLKTASCLE